MERSKLTKDTRIAETHKNQIQCT